MREARLKFLRSQIKFLHYPEMSNFAADIDFAEKGYDNSIADKRSTYVLFEGSLTEIEIIGNKILPEKHV